MGWNSIVDSLRLRNELLRRVKEDQRVRQTIPMHPEAESVDADNYNWIRSHVERYGMPGASLVGKRGAEAAFLLVQHAPHSEEGQAFQEKVLQMMKAAPHEHDPINMAKLEDRVLVGQGKPQLYGTQSSSIDGQPFKIDPIHEPEKVNERRRSIGLGPIEDEPDYA